MKVSRLACWKDRTQIKRSLIVLSSFG